MYRNQTGATRDFGFDTANNRLLNRRPLAYLGYTTLNDEEPIDKIKEAVRGYMITARLLYSLTLHVPNNMYPSRSGPWAI